MRDTCFPFCILFFANISLAIISSHREGLCSLPRKGWTGDKKAKIKADCPATPGSQPFKINNCVLQRSEPSSLKSMGTSPGFPFGPGCPELQIYLARDQLVFKNSKVPFVHLGSEAIQNPMYFNTYRILLPKATHTTALQIKETPKLLRGRTGSYQLDWKMCLRGHWSVPQCQTFFLWWLKYAIHSSSMTVLVFLSRGENMFQCKYKMSLVTSVFYIRIWLAILVVAEWVVEHSTSRLWF